MTKTHFCRFCQQEKEFTKNEIMCKWNTRCDECLKDWQAKGNFPKARCEQCDELFSLDFDPKKNYDLIPAEWICNQCKIIIN